MRRRMLVSGVVVLSAAAALTAPVAFAEPHPRPSAALLLSASHTASAVVTVPAAIHSGTPFDPLSVATTGRMAGFLISQLDGTPLLGRLVVRGVGLDPDEALPLWFSDDKDLRPGRYRITVIADAPAVVRVPWAARTSRTIRVAGPAHVFAARAASATPSAGPAGAPVEHVEIPVPAGSYHLAALFDFKQATASQASTDEECVSTTPICAAGGGDSSQGWILSPGSGGAGTASYGTAYTPADVPAGSQAVFNNADVGVSGSYSGLALLFG